VGLCGVRGAKGESSAFQKARKKQGILAQTRGKSTYPTLMRVCGVGNYNGTCGRRKAKCGEQK